jgi:NlpC/P60 family putative phage cell wall peptidase
MLARSDIVTAARGWLGTPYRHQASLKGIGSDCLGLIRGVWREIYGVEPESPPVYGASWTEGSGRETLADAARRHLIESPCTEYHAGDLLLFRWRPHLPARHAGIASSQSTMIHAQEHAAVSEIHLSDWWLRHLAFSFRFPGIDD